MSYYPEVAVGDVLTAAQSSNDYIAALVAAAPTRAAVRAALEGGLAWVDRAIDIEAASSASTIASSERQPG